MDNYSKMKLHEWIAFAGITRSEFSRRTGISKARITQLCAGAWMNRETAVAIVRETRGAVTPNDWLDLQPAQSTAARSVVSECVS